MTPSTNTEPIKPRSSWRMLGLMTLGMVILTIGCGFWWYFSDSDLEAVREQARLQGRPLSWSDMGLKPADPERLRMWKRVTELTAKLKSYQTIPSSQRKGGPIFKLWDPIPQEMRDYHQALDGAAITELIELLDRLGYQPLVLHEKQTFESSMVSETDHARELMRFMQERLLLADSSDTGAWGRRMIASCRRYSADSISQDMIRTALVGIAIGSITRRLTDLKLTDPNIAVDIMTIQPTHAHLLHAIDGEFLITLDKYSRRVYYTDHDSWMPLISRAGRQNALLSFLNDHRELDLLDDQRSLAWARSAEAKIRIAQGGIPYPSLILRGLSLPAWWYIRINQKNALRNSLLAAELQGQPWPIDTFDATGAVLRPITRDGRIIAAYSVGDDGIDQGGNEKKDHVFPLYAKP